MTRLCELLSNGTTGVVLGIAMMFLSIIGLITLIIGIYRLIAKPASGIYSEPDLLDRTDGDKPEYLNANEAPSVETDEIIAVISAAIATYLNRFHPFSRCTFDTQTPFRHPGLEPGCQTGAYDIKTLATVY